MPLPKSKIRSGLIAALDVGTTKVACFIARADDEGFLRVEGVGHHRARGMRGGQVINLDEAEASIRAAVDAAEQMAGERVEEVVVSVTAGQPTSSRVEVSLKVAGHEIRDEDVRRVLDHGRDLHDGGERDLVHCMPVGYAIDGHDGIVDPRGMFGEQLGVTILLVSAASGPLRNLATVIERCNLDIEDLVAAPYAAGLACLESDEKELGVTVVDLGGGSTTLAVFLDGHLAHAGTIPVGGQHVTRDLAKGLSTPLAEAERLKTVHGSAIASPADARALLKVPLVGESDDTAFNEVPRSMLTQIIQPRIEETLELVRSHLAAYGLDKLAGRRVVLTGGASQLQGIRELAELILDKQVRRGQPQRIRGLGDATGGPAFATCAGLLHFAMQDHVETPGFLAAGELPYAAGGPITRIGRWLKENF